MSRFFTTAALSGAALGALALSAGVALAQPSAQERRGDWDRERGRITLYEFPDFQGRSITLERSDSNLAPDGFADRARSVRVDGGDWRLCEHADFNGRCETVRADVRNLASLGLDRTVSSVLESPRNPGPFPPGTGDPDNLRDSLTLYEFPDFQGRSITLTGSDANLVPEGWNDRARSARVRDGSWRLCEHVDFGGRCQRIDGDVRNLAQLGLDRSVSSVRQGRDRDDDDWQGGGGWGRQEGFEGRYTVFYRRPTWNGDDINGGRFLANMFCRLQGHGEAVYFNTTERGRRVRGEGGRILNDAPVLRDVLCRKR